MYDFSSSMKSLQRAFISTLELKNAKRKKLNSYLKKIISWDKKYYDLKEWTKSGRLMCQLIEDQTWVDLSSDRPRNKREKKQKWCKE